MRTQYEQPIMRDRTYREVDDGDYLSQKQYLNIAVTLCVTHCLMELLYIWLGCTPMVLLNIISIMSYVGSIFLVKRGNTQLTVWILVLEVYFHVVFACLFMGMSCGYQLWLFGSFTSIFLPFFVPDLSKIQKAQIGIFCLIVVSTFLILTTLDDQGMMSSAYNPEPNIARIMYYCNALLGFGSIMIYMRIYNLRMAIRSREFQLAADHDFLTGIFNRQRMQKILDAEIKREFELGEGHLAVAIVDIDFFKKINDTYGHDIGDEALKELTKIFYKNSYTGLLYGRWGGEEFLLIAPENQTYEEFADLLEDIRKQVENNELKSGGQSIKYTVSIGAAFYERGMSSEKLVNTADDRLYDAKGTGRNKVVY